MIDSSYFCPIHTKNTETKASVEETSIKLTSLCSFQSSWPVYFWLLWQPQTSAFISSFQLISMRLLKTSLNSLLLSFPCGSAGKACACNVGDLGSIPGLGRSPGDGKGYPLQYSGLENCMDCLVHGVAKSRIQPSDFLTTSQQPPSPGLSALPPLLPCSFQPLSDPFSVPISKWCKG